jgi:two-component system sensor histidine kinase UhpB
MGGFMFVLGFFNRRESHLAYFGALSVGFAIVDSRLWLRSLPVSQTVAEFLLCAMLAFITLAAVQFLLRYAKWRHKWIDRALPLQCAADAGQPDRGRRRALVPGGQLLVRGLRGRGAGRRGVLPAPPVARALGVVLVDGRDAGGGGRLRPDRTAGADAGHAACVQPDRADRHAGDVRAGRPAAGAAARPRTAAGRAGKARLEQRIREATAEIEKNFNQLAELRVEQVTERERKRIAADLHDDLGAKLLTIVHTSDSERISTLAREALEEMRLSVRGLTGKPVRLADALGDWRAEVVSRLAQAGIEAEWTAPEDLPQTLSARAYVQTTRILREAVSNIIKHSGASHCSMKCTIADGDFQLVIQDNGDGIPMPENTALDRGHGMATMKQRAKQLQGQCLVESGPGYGTVIRLTLPLDRATEAA